MKTSISKIAFAWLPLCAAVLSSCQQQPKEVEDASGGTVEETVSLETSSNEIEITKNTTFNKARAGFQTKLTKQLNNSDYSPPQPNSMMFDLVKYTSGDNALSAYVSPDPEDSKKHPAIIWLVGGFSNSISDNAWESGEYSNDQSGATFRHAGVMMMYPCLRGGETGSGNQEGFLGEVDDVLAAVEHLKTLAYIDPEHIYVGGHSTGGTLALLVAAAAEDSVRSVFSLGPVSDSASYGEESLPYSILDDQERLLRAPILYLSSIQVPTYIIEGTIDGNLESLKEMQTESKNPKLKFHSVDGGNHFDIIAPVSEVIAKAINRSFEWGTDLELDVDEIKQRMTSRQYPPRPTFPKGKPGADKATYELGLYFKGEVEKDAVLDQLTTLISSHEKFKLADEKRADDEVGVIPIFVDDVNQKGYAPPGLERMRYKSYGVDEATAKEIQTCKSAVRVWFRASGENIVPSLREAYKFMIELETKLDGFLWDETTRQIFTPIAWEKRRINTWQDTYPDIRFHITVHAYPNPENIRGITLGMEKFGLPDILMDQFSRSDFKGVGEVVNGLAQVLLEGTSIDEPDAFQLQINDIKTAEVRNAVTETIEENGSGEITLALKRGPWDLGDPENRIIEIQATHYEGPDLYSKTADMIATFVGFVDEVKNVKHDEALKQASEQAKAKLPSLRKDFLKGYEPGTILLVKAPFVTTEGGNEWMWVEIKKWEEDGKIVGTLQSEPYNVPELKSGQEVTVQQKDLFDYILRLPDGSMEGNKTGDIIRAMQGG